jgi:hypothetical protein
MKRKKEKKNQDDARPPTARRNASPADCGAESLAKVPAFMAANTFIGFVSFCAGPPPADGDIIDGERPLPNCGCPKPGLNPVGSTRKKKHEHEFSKMQGR